MLTVGTRVQFMVSDPDVHSPILEGEIVKKPRLETGKYTVLADTIVWAHPIAREEGNIAMTHYELPEDLLAVQKRRSVRLETLRANRDWAMWQISAP